MYVPLSSVTPGLKKRDLIYDEPSRDIWPGTPPGGLLNDMITVGVPTNLSTTPSSLQMMLKLSPAVGIPGIMISGVNRSLLSATIILR